MDGSKEMLSAIDSGILRRLAFSKNAYYLSEHLLTLETDVANAEALVICDAAIESLLRTILQYKEIDPKNTSDFPSLIKSVKKNIIDEMKEKPSIIPFDRLHISRNEVQHRYILPIRSQVEQNIREAVGCANEFVNTIFGFSWTDVSISWLFTDGLVRELFQRSEAVYISENIDDAIVYLVRAFEYAKSEEQSCICGSGITMKKVKASSCRDRSLFEYTSSIHDEIEIMKLRLDYKEYRRYCDIAPGKLTPAFLGDGVITGTEDEMHNNWKKRLSLSQSDDYKNEWYRFAILFVEKSIIKWQMVRRVNVFDGLRSIVSLFSSYTRSI